MATKDGDKSSNFEEISSVEVVPQQPMQVGSYMERSYSADELEEPMKVYPRTSERANEGQELTVRKRLMLTETDESTVDSQRERISQTPSYHGEQFGRTSGSADALGLGGNLHVFPDIVKQGITPVSDLGSNVSLGPLEEIKIFSTDNEAQAASGAENIYDEVSEKSDAVPERIVADIKGQSVDVAENAQPAAQRNQVSTSQHNTEQFHAFQVVDSVNQELNASNRPKNSEDVLPGVYNFASMAAYPMHPIENSRQKWELTGGTDEEDIRLDDLQKSNAVAIAPMRLTLTNESELEVESIEIDLQSGNNDANMRLIAPENPNVEVQPMRSMANPEDVNYQKVKTPLKCPSSQEDFSVQIKEERGDQLSYSANTPIEPPTANLSIHEADCQSFSSVDTQNLCIAYEYVFNMEDSRPPWVIEAHTYLGSSKVKHTPKCVKAFDEQVEAGGEPSTTDCEDDGTLKTNLFHKHLIEMSETMNSVDHVTILSANSFEEEEEVDDEKEMIRETTPIIMSEPNKKIQDLLEEHENSLTKGEIVKHIVEQHTDRRIMAKPLETSCPTCDFAASDVASSHGSTAASSKRYPCAKRRSQQNIDINFTENERIESPKEEGEVDPPQLRRPSPTTTGYDTVERHPIHASETYACDVAADKEGDLCFYPEEDSAQPFEHKRSVDKVKENYSSTQPTQRRCNQLQCIDEDESTDETGAFVNLDDARKNLWFINPKEHRGKYTQMRDLLPKAHGENFDGKDRDGPENAQKENTSEEGSGGGNDSGLESAPNNPVFEPFASLQTEELEPAVNFEQKSAAIEEEQSETFDDDSNESIKNDDFQIYSDHRKSGGSPTESKHTPVDRPRHSPVTPISRPRSYLEDGSNDRSTGFKSQGLKSRTENSLTEVFDVSGDSFHSAERDVLSPIHNFQSARAVESEHTTPSALSGPNAEPQMSYSRQERVDSTDFSNERLHEEASIEPVPEPVNVPNEVHSDFGEQLNDSFQSQSELHYRNHSIVSLNLEPLDVGVDANGNQMTIQQAVQSPMTTEHNVSPRSPLETFYQPPSKNLQREDSMSSKSVESFKEANILTADVQVSSDEVSGEKCSVDVPKASQTEKCIITKQRVKPIPLDEFTQIMETPRFGPEEQANENTINSSASEGPAVLYNANVPVAQLDGHGESISQNAEKPIYENVGNRRESAFKNKSSTCNGQGSQQSLSEMDSSASGSTLKLTKSRTQSITDGHNYVSQSVRGSQFSIDMRTISTPVSLNLPVSLANNEDTASTSKSSNNQSHAGEHARNTPYKSGATRPESSGMRRSNSNFFVNTPRTPAVDMSLASPRELPQGTIVSSQSLERQIRLTRVRTKSRRGGDNNSFRMKGSPSENSGKFGFSAARPGGGTLVSKMKRTLTKEREVASGDEINLGTDVMG